MCHFGGMAEHRYLARQAHGLQGKTEIESNLHQLLKLRAEDVPELLEWIDNGRYLSHDIINELINMMGNAVLQSIVVDLCKHSQLFSLLADESRDKQQGTINMCFALHIYHPLIHPRRFRWYVQARKNRC